MNFTPATRADCAELGQFAARLFSETFGHLYRLENLAAHNASHHSEAYFAEALRAGDTILLLRAGGAIVGYGKIGGVALPLSTPAPAGAQEIHRVYIDSAHHGRGLGKALMHQLLALPRIVGAPITDLGVWEHNHKARALYAGFGFLPTGTYKYQVPKLEVIRNEHYQEIIEMSHLLAGMQRYFPRLVQSN